MRCSQCGYVQVQNEECVRCGKTLAQSRPRPSIKLERSNPAPGKRALPVLKYIPSSHELEDKKNPRAAAWLNFLLPGAGYIYTGRSFYGISLLLIFVSCALGACLGIYALMPISLGMSMVSTLNSYLSVKKQNQGLDGRLSVSPSQAKVLPFRRPVR